MSLSRPGSFSKNFAWHGAGLRKLQETIIAGFGNTLTPVERSAFRAACGIDDESLQLIPVNFFLFNDVISNSNMVAVDELVFQALFRPHSLAFDRLALFALNLNSVGKRVRSQGEAHPVGWINEFVRERLWEDDCWNVRSLDKGEMDAYFDSVLDATQEVRIKCRSNYRHLFELCQYVPNQGQFIDPGLEDWVCSAIFLTWDRLMMAGAIELDLTKNHLLEAVHDQELHKLMGAAEEHVADYSKVVVDDYISVGGPARFKQDDGGVGTKGQQSFPSPKKQYSQYPKDALDLTSLQEEKREEVTRRRKEVNAQVRDAKLAASIKLLYGNCCQFCQQPLQVGVSPARFYSEAAHIKGLGKPDGGPDVPSNLLVLCPNHHKQLDSGILLLERVDLQHIKIVSTASNHPLDQKVFKLREGHQIDDEYLLWHSNKWRARTR